MFILANSTLAPLDGDFNDNGVVDAADYVVWRKGLGTTYSPSDRILWRSQFGLSIPGAGAGSGEGGEPVHAAVPEPAGFVLLALGLIVGFNVRRAKLPSV